MQEENNDIYIKFLKGELTDSDKEQLKSTGEYAVLDKILLESGSWKMPPVKDSFTDFKQKKLVQQSKSNRSWLRIAASVAIIIGLSTFSYLRFFNITALTTGTGESLAVILPDGCEVTLNGNSSLSYNNWNWDEKREVEMNGQAYFDISVKGPMNVSFNGGSVDVVGTQFDIMSHNNANVVKCFEGTVDVSFSDKTYRLTESMGVRNTVTRTKEEFGFEGTKPTWLTDYTQFKNTPLNEVVNALSLRYGLTFELNKQKMETLSFTGQFPNNDDDQALKMVFESMSISYTKTGETVVLK